MKKRVTILLVLLSAYSNMAYTQINCDWAFNPPDTATYGGDITGQSIKVDGSGNSYIAGTFSEIADFDPGSGIANLASAGNKDIFIAKYDASGNLIYAKSIGGVSSDYLYSMVIDAVGNVYITGSFSGTADFDPGAGTANLTSAGDGDIFIAKYDASGNYVYAKAIGGAYYDRGNSIAIDASGNAIITGLFYGTADFDPGPGTANLSPVGDADIFIAKYDAAGNYVYAKSIGGNNTDQGTSIAVDASGNVFITGGFSETADFDPGAGTANLTSAGGMDIFIAKYDASGNYVFAKSMGGVSYEQGTSIAIDGSGNAFITGGFLGTADFDPGAGTANLTSAGNGDIFIAKYDASGNYVYAKNMGGASDDYGNSIAIDASGNAFITGYFQETVDFDPGAGTANLTSAGSYDIFIAKYDASGNYIYAKSLGGTSIDIGCAIAIDASGNAFITGLFFETADFDPGPGTANLMAGSGWNNAFIGKYNTSGNYIWAGAWGGYGNNYYHQSGTCVKTDISGNVYITGFFEGTVDFDPGAGTAYLTSAGGPDIFIAKYDASGNYIYAISMGGASLDQAGSMAIDGSGNVFITGFFMDTADFDPGAGTAYLTSAGFNDIFIAKYDAAGNYVYAKSMGGTSRDEGISIDIDSSGNAYITGSFSETVDFDPGAGTANLTSAGGGDIFIAKYDAAGNYIYAKNMGGASDENVRSIDVDAIGNAYIVGSFQDTVDFDPGVGTANLVSAGSYDIFIAKYDAAGNYVYAKNMGGPNYDFGGSIAIDASGNAFITGLFLETADFDPGPDTANLTSAGVGDIFVAKYDASGNYVYAKNMGGTSFGTGISIAIDASGNTIITGNFYGTIDFDPGAGTANLTALGNSDIFIAKYDASGNYVYAKNMGGTANEYGNSIAIDTSGNAFITGYFMGTIDVDPCAGLINLQALNGQDVFLAKYSMPTEINIIGNGVSIADGDATPDLADHTDFGAANVGTPITRTFTIENIGPEVLNLTGTPRVSVSGSGFGLTTDAPTTIASGNTATFQVTFTPPNCGLYAGTISIANNDTDENPYNFSIAGTGIDNVAPLTPTIADATGECSVTPGTPTTTDACVGTVTGTTSTSFPITTQGTTVVTWTFNDGNGNSTTANQNVIVDDITSPTFTCPANVDLCVGYASINIAPTNMLDNCSPVVGVTYKLTGATSGTGSNDASSEPFNVGTTFVNYIFDDGNGNKDSCQISVKINPEYSFTENHSICNGETYNWQGNDYTLPGNYTANYLSIHGCDSIYELDLTADTVDVSLTITDPTITAIATADAYQWLDCDNFYAPIGGAIFQSYTATANGNYAVIVTQGLCSDTSACVPIITVGIASENLPGIAIYPNPSNGQFTLELNENAKVEIYNALGSLIYNATFEKGKHTLSLNLANGVYLLKATNDKVSRSLRVVIQK
jgi:hypothetical protein